MNNYTTEGEDDQRGHHHTTNVDSKPTTAIFEPSVLPTMTMDDHHNPMQRATHPRPSPLKWRHNDCKSSSIPIDAASKEDVTQKGVADARRKVGRVFT
jgi:hypothetical protein